MKDAADAQPAMLVGRCRATLRNGLIEAERGVSYEQLSEHQSYLDDEIKLERYGAAIAALVRPGDVVLDLGAGTGILGLMAAKAGARRVYSVDGGSIIEVVRQLATANNYEDVIVAIRQVSTLVTLPEPVDVVVGDQIGGLAFDAGVNIYYADAARRLLRPGGTTIPARFELALAAVEAADEWASIERWSARPAGFDTSPVRALAVNTVRPVQLSAGHLLGPSVVLAKVDATADDDFELRGRLEITRPGILHGVLGTFRAEMAPGIWMTNDPSEAEPMRHRWQNLYPIDNAVPMHPGDSLDVVLRASPKTELTTWSVAVRRSCSPVGDTSGGLSWHSSFLGRLLSAEDLKSGEPTDVPSLDPQTLAVLAYAVGLLGSCNTLAEIEGELRKAYPSYFRSREDLLSLVTSLLRQVERMQ